MHKYLLPLFFLFNFITLQAKSTDISQTLRNTYSSNLYSAFFLQSQGKSNVAFIQFDSAREEAKKAGENPLKIAAIEQLFYWYRKYGSALNLFAKNPTGHDRIIDEYRPRSYNSLGTNPYDGYKSEWGKTPEQAALVRTFMVGVGELISGVFIATVNPGWGYAIGGVLWYDGVSRIYDSLNNLWANHEAMICLKNWEQTTAKAMKAE